MGKSVFICRVLNKQEGSEKPILVWKYWISIKIKLIAQQTLEYMKIEYVEPLEVNILLF